VGGGCKSATRLEDVLALKGQCCNKMFAVLKEGAVLTFHGHISVFYDARYSCCKMTSDLEMSSL